MQIKYVNAPGALGAECDYLEDISPVAELSDAGWTRGLLRNCDSECKAVPAIGVAERTTRLASTDP